VNKHKSITPHKPPPIKQSTFITKLIIYILT
jgi:hypothetical protein